VSRRVLAHWHRLVRERRAVAMIELALALPLFLGFVLSGLEFAHWVLANNRTQRLASMTADLVAQSGVGSVGASEKQIYDLFSAIDITARPFDLRNYGRVVISSVKGTDNDGDGVVESRFLWQRFDGNYIAAVPLLGCAKSNPIAALPAGRVLPLDEILFHVQVTYDYRPLFSRRPFGWLNLGTAITRTATYRARNTQFQSPSAVDKFPAKEKCTTADGL
jgi:Flp pilus assembly protein TadG